MKKTLMLNMAEVDEETVDDAVDYLLEIVENMLEEGVSMTEVLVALGQAAGHVVDMLTNKGRLH